MHLLDRDAWQEIGDALRTNPVRTALTMAGVFWGTFMLVAMMGFSSGLEEATYRTMRGTVTNAVFVWGGRTRMPYRGRRPGRGVRFDNDDIPVLRAVPGLRHLAPRNQLGGYRDGTPVRYGQEIGAFQVMGDAPAFAHIQTVEFDGGRFINDLDMLHARKVAVIGRQVYTTLWPDGGDPIGEWIGVRGVFFRVVGLFHSSTGDDRGDRDEQTIHIPFTTFQQAFHAGNRVNWFAFVADENTSGIELEKRVRATLAQRHVIHPDDARAMGGFNSEEAFKRIQGLFIGIRGLTWLVGIATLLSGAVGVSNVMLIVVRERTQEIGVRRALGATPMNVVGMVLQEAMAMTAVAGMAGVVAGVALLEIAALGIGPDNPSFGMPRVQPLMVMAATVLLIIAGLVAGVLPARRAVAIQPVDALRAE